MRIPVFAFALLLLLAFQRQHVTRDGHLEVLVVEVRKLGRDDDLPFGSTSMVGVASDREPKKGGQGTAADVKNAVEDLVDHAIDFSAKGNKRVVEILHFAGGSGSVLPPQGTRAFGMVLSNLILTSH